LRRAVIWTGLTLIALVLASFLFLLRPYFVELSMRREAKAIAEVVASEIVFISKMRESGAIAGQRVLNVELEENKLAEIMIYNDSVVVRLIADSQSVTASVGFISSIPVISPPKVYGGKIIFILSYNSTANSYFVHVTNLVGTDTAG